MRKTFIAGAALAALAAAPAQAESAHAEQAARKNGIGVVAGGLVGALLGGPPGALAGMMLGGYAVDREQAVHRSGDLERQNVALEGERRSLASERISLKASIEDLHAELARERDLAASAVDMGMLADGLEFAVGFRTNSATPPDELSEGLEALAMLVGAVPSLEIHLDGYADPRGSDALNAELSLARAAAIRERLVRAGIDPERIHVTGHGAVANDGDPAADPDSWALQRRVSIRVESGEGRLAASP
jgi:outer membrane protein OmpA-like peptidoglycan-associated protein